MSDENRTSRGTGADDGAPLEPWLQALARDYNRPPPTPRELIWSRIQAERATGARLGEVVENESAPLDEIGAVDDDDGGRPNWLIQVVGGNGRGGGAAGGARRLPGVAGRAGGRGLSAWRWPSVGAAAALLLMAALGWLRSGPASPGPGAETVALGPVSGPVIQTSVQLPAAGSADGADSGLSEGVVAPAPVLPRRRTAGPTAGSGPSRPARRASNAVAGSEVVGAAATFRDAPYRIAAAQHLGQVEALLTVFRTESGRDVADPSLQPWARELLTTTRLLLDSPAARDERVDSLLGELEPVLVQIVQLPAARAAEERQLIARSLERSSLLNQLRSAVPAGSAQPQRAGE